MAKDEKSTIPGSLRDHQDAVKAEAEHVSAKIDEAFGKLAPEDPLDPIEALKHIRTVVEATADLAYGTPTEPTFRGVMKILDKALPPRRRRPPTAQ